MEGGLGAGRGSLHMQTAHLFEAIARKGAVLTDKRRPGRPPINEGAVLRLCRRGLRFLAFLHGGVRVQRVLVEDFGVQLVAIKPGRFDELGALLGLIFGDGHPRAFGLEFDQAANYEFYRHSVFQFVVKV